MATAAPKVAIATSYYLRDLARAHECGFVKWCYSSTRLLELPAFGGRAETVLWTNAAGEQYVRAECGALAPRRFVRFRPELEALAAAWAEAVVPHWRRGPKALGRVQVCRNASGSCFDTNRSSFLFKDHLGPRRVNDVSLLKWQLVAHVEYDAVFFVDLDVDFAVPAAPAPTHISVAALDGEWRLHLHRFLASERVSLIAATDFETPLNTGVMLLKPSAAAYDRGVRALRSMRWNLTHGFEHAGTPCALAPRAAKQTSWKMPAAAPKLGVHDWWNVRNSWGMKTCTWNFNGATTDQGLFAYVFLLLDGRSALHVNNRDDTIWRVKHLWGPFKPWHPRSTNLCCRYFDFLDSARYRDATLAGGEDRGARCAQPLRARREQCARENRTKARRCGGVWVNVF